MRLERRLCEPKLDELLLLHELCVRAVVDDVFAEYGRREGPVDFLGVDVGELAVEDEFVARETQVAG